ncbi:hypothetical protein SAMN02745866_01681 [Alteromonadaceae bacterium Bs31]|nr:hypothetical protein SAMN02745866_01681 [Alteromonadaceae bacterium Bs31]
MSYLNNLRLVFSGRFQSDVSTVNNDVTHFDSANFQAKFQEYGMPGGWWNPCGSGAFRLLDCVVNEVGYSDGSTISDAQADPVIGMLIGGSNQSVSGKMVDLDPQMQMVSEIWGLEMRLCNDLEDGLFSGKFLPAPFRDILFGRQQQGGGGDQTATAIYQSVLEDLSWIDSSSSTFLQQLKAASPDKLSVRMMLYSYNMDHTNPEFTLGYVSGVIGPAAASEPNTFILGRRFAPANGRKTAENINFFNAQLNVYENAGIPRGDLCVDLSNALSLANGQGDFVNIGQVQVVALNGEFSEGSEGLTESDYTAIGEPIPYLDTQWLQSSGAIFNVSALSGPELQSAQTRQLALLQLEKKKVLITETQNGYLVRADQVVHRLNPADTTKVDFYAAAYGVPLSGSDITVSLQAVAQGTSGGDAAPTINHPASAIHYPTTITTGTDGKATLSLTAENPENPRGYIDGQVFLLSYSPVGQPKYIQHMFDFVASLVFDNFAVPANPSWEDIQAIMTQYGNLYPVMSRMLVDLGNYESVVEYRSILELAFSRPLSDPNYMPVTRDLSAGKRAAILQWLRAKGDNGQYLLARSGSSAGASAIEPCASCEISSTPPMESAAALADRAENQPDAMRGSKLYASQQYQKNLKN